jgi:hypothetical protein
MGGSRRELAQLADKIVHLCGCGGH